MKKEDAKKRLLEEGRFNLTVDGATDICNAFGVELDKKLIRTSRGYRENVVDETEPRVNVATLSKFICEKTKKKPDKKTLSTANRMSGEGSFRDLKSKAYAINL